MKLGSFQIDAVTEGHFKVDGGVLFGRTPRRVWSQWVKPDRNNFVTLPSRVVLLRGGRLKKNWLIDAGFGDKVPPEAAKRLWGLERPAPDALSRALRKLKCPPEDIDFVLFTHLHQAHAGGATRFAEDGKTLVPAFPNAAHFVQTREYAHAAHGHLKGFEPYYLENFAPLHEMGRLHFYDGNHVTSRGEIELVLTGGHTPGHQAVVVQTGVGRAVCLGGLAPTEWHRRGETSNGFDHLPEEGARRTLEFAGRVRHEGWKFL